MKPTLEEVKEKYKNAKEVKSVIHNETFTIIDIDSITDIHENAFYILDTDYVNRILWSKDKGFAEIVSYKSDKPLHYQNKSDYDVIAFNKDNDLNFNEGNIVKYITRCRKKGQHLEDLKKCLTYIKREIEYVESTSKN